MINVRPFVLDDLDLISPMPSDVPYRISKMPALLEGLALSVFDDDALICCGGVMKTSPGVGTAWLHADKSLAGDRDRITYVFRTSLKALTFAHNAMGLHRVQATAFTTNEAAVKWLYRLGFEAEGVMKRFGPHGEHAILFARYGEEDC